MRKLAGVTVIDRTARTAEDVAAEIFAAWRDGPPAPGAPSLHSALRTPPRTDT
jgi:hypothetical protein